MSKIHILIILVVIQILVSVSFVNAASKYTVDMRQSNIKCSVKYAVLPTLKAHFTDYYGEIVYDPKHLGKSSVEFHFSSAGLDSGEKHVNTVIRSRRVLDVKKFPEITFLSKEIFLKDGQLWVEGVVTLHGVSKRINFPFKVEELFVAGSGKKKLMARGKWVLNRKEFNIIWHPQLDKGGVIVGDYITIDWTVTAIKS